MTRLMATDPNSSPSLPHTPVMLDEVLKAVSPVRGTWLDGTFGGGGYTIGLLKGGADHVLGIDCDPEAEARASALNLGGGFTFVHGKFGDFDSLEEISRFLPLDGVVLDLGVSSMQIDRAERGFSFSNDGPLDMRMRKKGRTAADIVNGESEESLAELIFSFGQERAAKRIARRIANVRRTAPIETTRQLADIVKSCFPGYQRIGKHPATRSFLALRIAVNDELEQLVRGLEAAERALRPDGRIAIVSFHSGEDRIVKRFLKGADGAGARANRHSPPKAVETPRFDEITRGAVRPSPEEVGRNPRARSARLRAARRNSIPPAKARRLDLGVPVLEKLGSS